VNEAGQGDDLASGLNEAGDPDADGHGGHEADVSARRPSVPAAGGALRSV